MKMQTTAKLRYLRVSPRKVRLLVDLVRGMKVSDAVMQLSVSAKDAAIPLRKLISSAVANARHNHAMKEDTLTIREATVDGGPMYYRWQPKAFGRAAPFRKRTAHVTIVLEGEVEEKQLKPKKESKQEVEQVTEKTEVEKDN